VGGKFTRGARLLFVVSGGLARRTAIAYRRDAEAQRTAAEVELLAQRADAFVKAARDVSICRR